MQFSGSGEAPVLDVLLTQAISDFDHLAPPAQLRLREMAGQLASRGLPQSFITSSLRSTAEVLREIHEGALGPDEVFRREHVRRFIEQNAVRESSPNRYQAARERKREERERTHANVVHLLREARQARGRHEVKKTRNRLLKLDQRELRRILGSEGEDLCRQINTWLRSTASMF